MDDQKISLKELLRLSYPNESNWLVVGDEITQGINWVVSKVDDVGSGDVLLVESSAFDVGLIESIQTRKGAGIILMGEGKSKLNLKDIKIPVVSLQIFEGIRDVQRLLLNILINQRAHLMERSVQIHAHLLKMAAEGEGLSGLIRTMSELTGRGVVLQNKRLDILADFPSTSLVQIWDSVLEEKMGAENLPGEFSDRKEAGKDVLILRQQIHDDLARIITPVTVGGVARGFLSLVDVDQNLDALDSVVIEQGALVCAIEMSRAKAVREAEKRLKGDLLTALLQENITPRDANLWVQSMGLDLDMEHVAIRFAWDASETPSMRRLETLVNGEVTSRGDIVLVEALGSEIVCICQVDPDSSRPGTALDLAGAVAALAKEEFPDIPMRCGVGSPAGDLIDWRDSFRQAGQALEMARRLNDRAPRYFPDLSVYRLLLQLELHPDLQIFKNEILGPLLSYEGGGDLVKTLDAYFENNAVLSHAAEALFIHRNTLIYRMERIAEITGLDLANNETRLAVQLALRIHHMTTQ